MGAYVKLGPVRTWYDERGEGNPLVLMHGGLVDARFFDPNVGPLAERFHVFLPERRGHGHTPDVDGPRMPTTSPSTMPGRPNWLPAAWYCPRRSALRFFAARAV